MTPFPGGDLPGHAQLLRRATAALETCQETTAIEFKASAKWDALKVSITKTVIAMANLRDGGLIIIGVRQDGQQWSLTGIFPGDLDSFNQDHIESFVNSFASPALSLDIVLVPFARMSFLVISVPEFVTTPHVCKKNGPDGSRLFEGDFLVRLPGPPRTSRVTSSEQMHNLLDLASEKRARAILRQAQRVGLSLEVAFSDELFFNGELGGL